MTKTAKPLSASPKIRMTLLATGAALLGLALVARHNSTRGIPSVDPKVSLERIPGDDSTNSSAPKRSANFPDDGEVYRTAARLREASALALAGALYAASEQVNRHVIANADVLVAAISSTGLLPPGVTVSRGGMLLAEHSSFTLRFRPKPLSIEVLSFPRSREDGPPLMVRIPSLSDDGKEGSVFIADRLGDIRPPAPFASLVDCVSAGWIDQSFDQGEIPEAQEQQLRAWLANRVAK